MSAKEQYTQEERLLAAISHASVVAGAIGPVVGVLVYITPMLPGKVYRRPSTSLLGFW